MMVVPRTFASVMLLAAVLPVGVAAAETDEFFGKAKDAESLPVSGPALDKSLQRASFFKAKHVTESWLNPSSTLL